MDGLGHHFLARAGLALDQHCDIQGRHALDLCAAPGGKTLQLAAAGAKVTAIDVSPARLERLRENLSRCRLSAEIVEADALEWAPPEPFDAATSFTEIAIGPFVPVRATIDSAIVVSSP